MDFAPRHKTARNNGTTEIRSYAQIAQELDVLLWTSSFVTTLVKVTGIE